MKKIVLITLSLIVIQFGVKAQKFGFVDTGEILENIPEYREAQKELDDLSVKWQNQIEAKYADIDRMYKSYQAEQVLMTDDMKRKREDEIIKKEKEAKDYQKSKFGVDGELFKKRQELVQPIQDKIYNTVKEIATEGNYAIIFDSADQSNILFSSSKYDKSEDVLKKLGYDKGSK